MAKKFLVDLNLAGNELQQAALENRTDTSQAPISQGEIFLNTGDSQVYVSLDGTNWSVVGKTYAAGDGIGLSGTTFSVDLVDTDPGLEFSGGELQVDSSVVRTSGAQTIGGAKTFSDSATFSSDVSVGGNLTVLGTLTRINTVDLEVTDNTILLNSSYTGDPDTTGVDAGIEIERGTGDNVAVKWDETNNRWTFTNDGTQYENIPTPNEYTNNTGTVTSVSGGTGLTGSVTTTGNINVDYAGADNIVLAAGDGTSITVASTDKLMVSDATDSGVKYVNVSQLPFTNNVGDITAVTAGSGLTGGGTSGGVTVTNAYYRRTFSIANNLGTGTLQTIIANCVTEGIVPATVVVSMAENTGTAVVGVMTDWEVDITGDGVVKAFVPDTGAWEITVTALRA